MAQQHQSTAAKGQPGQCRAGGRGARPQPAVGREGESFPAVALSGCPCAGLFALFQRPQCSHQTRDGAGQGLGL